MAEQLTRIQLYWRRVREVEKDLRAQGGLSVSIISVANADLDSREGQVCEADFETAARRLVEGTHKIATAEQIERDRQAQQERAALTRQTDARISGLNIRLLGGAK